MKIGLAKGFLYASLVVAAGAAIIVGVVLLRPAERFDRSRLSSQSQFVLAADLINESVPLHSTYTVPVEVTSQEPIKELQLWVNGQLWGNQEFFNHPASQFQAAWDWTPSGEGEHTLFVRVKFENGSQTESQSISIFAMQSLDARVPYQYTTMEGETPRMIADQFGVDPQLILANNPGVVAGESETIPADVALLIPIPIANKPPAYPESGEAAAPPTLPLPPSTSPGLVAGGDTILNIGQDLPSAALMPGFQIVGSELITPVEVDRLYLYFHLADAEWKRSPTDPHSFHLPNANGNFNLKLDLDLEGLQKLPEPIPLEIEAWGWKGDTLVFLGVYSDKVGGPGGSLTWPPLATQLKARDYQSLGKTFYTQEVNLSGDQNTLEVEFNWFSSEPGVSYARWEVSTLPYNTLLKNVSLPIHSGMEFGSEGQFTLDFEDYLKPLPGSDADKDLINQLSEAVSDAVNNGLSTSAESVPQQVQWPFLPGTFYVRVIPFADNDTAAKPSNIVRVNYIPSGMPIPVDSAVDGPVYEAKIVSFIPFRAADPSYANCSVLNTAFGSLPEGTPLCGCPGVSCEDVGGDECGDLSLGGFGDCLEKGAGAIKNAVEAAVDFGTNTYNSAKKFIIDTVASMICPSSAEAECKVAITIGVNAGLAALGLPPEIPDIDKLMDEGLEYAVAVAAEEITGFDCNKQCRELLKKGFTVLTSGENLFEEGLEVGISIAADEINEIEGLDIDCDAKCENIIKSGAQGKLTPGSITEAALEQAAEEAAIALNKEGYVCDQQCKNLIKDGLQKGVDLAASVAASAEQSAASQQLSKPHPLAVDQPALVKVEIFRRWESSEIPDDLIAKCGLSLYSHATNTLQGQAVSGDLFAAVGLELPVLDPGETITIPVALERKAWESPVETPAPSGAAPGGAVQAALASIYGDWDQLYYGAEYTLKATGPLFLAPDGQGGTQSVPCIAEDSLSRIVP